MRIQENEKKEREPSKEKPEINASSGNMIEKKKLSIFESIYAKVNPNRDMFIDPTTINYKNITIELIDILMDVFTDFEEALVPWDKQTFLNKCNDAY
jgi:hypothetical protein